MASMALDILSNSKVCRLCLALTRTYIDILENSEISGMLTTLTSIKIESNDEISTIMCLKCRLNLNLAYKIQQNMLKAEERFREQLLSVKIKSPCIEIDPSEIKKETTETVESIDEDEVEDCFIKIDVLQNQETQIETVEESNTENLTSPEVDKTCDICGKVLPTKSLLVRHRYFHKKSKCPICSKELTKSNLRTHMQIHTHDPQICDICGVTLKTKSNLRQHIFYSHNAARHKCAYCDKVFVKKSNRDTHQRKEHLGEAEFICDTCGKKFYTNRSLNTHVKMTHLKLRPYVCEYCNCGFSSAFAMKTHRRQHTNETPYRCEVCGEGFRQKVSLRSHRKSKHNIVEEETCRCTVCGKGFASQTALYTHQRIH